MSSQNLKGGKYELINTMAFTIKQKNVLQNKVINGKYLIPLNQNA